MKHRLSIPTITILVAILIGPAFAQSTPGAASSNPNPAAQKGTQPSDQSGIAGMAKKEEAAIAKKAGDKAKKTFSKLLKKKKKKHPQARSTPTA